MEMEPLTGYHWEVRVSHWLHCPWPSTLERKRDWQLQHIPLQRALSGHGGIEMDTWGRVGMVPKALALRLHVESDLGRKLGLQVPETSCRFRDDLPVGSTMTRGTHRSKKALFLRHRHHKATLKSAAHRAGPRRSLSPSQPPSPREDV